MTRISGILLSALLILIGASGCILNATGTHPVDAIDPNFHGCFERSDAPGGRIIIIQESSNLLRGTGSGLFSGEDLGWTFTGEVTAERVATLHITMEGESGFEVNASIPDADPPDDLTLQREGRPSVILSRCP